MSHFPASFEIDGRRIGKDASVYVIAEAGVNHFGEMDKAVRLIDCAVAAKADCFKTQHYDTDTLIGPSSLEWRDRLRPRQLPDHAIRKMRDSCFERGIPFLCTPHDATALQFLHQELNVSAFKIGSGEVLNWPYLAEIGRLGKPIILSTGMYELEEIACAINVLREAGCQALAVLHCVTSYPADPSSINLAVMGQIRSFFDGPVGYSDHTEGTATPLAAVALGADVIEKHITLDRDVPNAQDWKVSCDEETFPKFVADIREIEQARGGGPKVVGENEHKAALWARKSLTFVADLQPGHQLEKSDILLQRPGTGIPGSKLKQFLGRQLSRPVAAGSLLSTDDFD